jgi:hypothetical protein
MRTVVNGPRTKVLVSVLASAELLSARLDGVACRREVSAHFHSKRLVDGVSCGHFRLAARLLRTTDAEDAYGQQKGTSYAYL